MSISSQKTSFHKLLAAVFVTLLAMVGAVQAQPAPLHGWPGLRDPGPAADVTFIQFTSPNLAVPGATLTIEGKLSIPRRSRFDVDGARATGRLPAVVILHGSSGVDARGDFYEAGLNAAGIATLQIDMWQARGITDPSKQRPAAPILTYPDAFSALAFLSNQPQIDASRIGVLGFSWGGIVSLGAAEQLYVSQFGGGRTFKAHVANYPVCYGWNNNQLAAAGHTTPAQFGSQLLHLTGAPVLIQIGTLDDYDKSAGPCYALAQTVNSGNGPIVSVNAYPGDTHGWDRLMVPSTVTDPFANLGSYFSTGQLPTVRLVPDVEQAYGSRSKVVRFFVGTL